MQFPAENKITKLQIFTRINGGRCNNINVLNQYKKILEKHSYYDKVYVLTIGLISEEAEKILISGKNRNYYFGDEYFFTLALKWGNNIDIIERFQPGGNEYDRQFYHGINAGTRWTTEQEKQLTELFNSGMRISEIARIMQRSHGGIRARLIRLGLIEGNQPPQATENNDEEEEEIKKMKE